MAKREEELKEIRAKTTEEINDEIVDLKGEFFFLRLQKSARADFKSSEFSRIGKRDIKFAVHAHTTLSEVLEELYKAAKLEVYNRCYSEQPLVIQGAGASNDTTTVGVPANILDIQDLFT